MVSPKENESSDRQCQEESRAQQRVCVARKPPAQPAEAGVFSPTHRSQSTAMMRVTSSAGRPTALSTITMVTMPAWGTPAAPMLAAVAVILQPKHNGRKGLDVSFSQQGLRPETGSMAVTVLLL